MIRHVAKIIAGFCLIIVFSAGLLSPSAYALEIRQLTSPKGIKLWFVKEINLPIIQMRFLWRGGAANFDPGLSSNFDPGLIPNFDPGPSPNFDPGLSP